MVRRTGQTFSSAVSVTGSYPLPVRMFTGTNQSFHGVDERSELGPGMGGEDKYRRAQQGCPELLLVNRVCPKNPDGVGVAVGPQLPGWFCGSLRPGFLSEGQGSEGDVQQKGDAPFEARIKVGCDGSLLFHVIPSSGKTSGNVS